MEIVKFGGSSFSTESTIRLCGDIVRSSPKHKVIVVSAPGKHGVYNTKVTDELIKLTTGHHNLDEIIKRFDDIATKILPSSKYELYKLELYKTKNKILNHLEDYNFVVSRGEYLSAKLFSLYLDFNFVDAEDILVINEDSTADLESTALRIKKLKLKRKCPFVIGGFYGQRNGKVTLFTRGGSDYTGAILAALMNAKLYKNYTDTNGIKTADPNIVYGTRTIQCLDFDSLDILTHNGAGIIHENVATLLKTYRIPLRVDNTFNPDKDYTEVHSTKCRKCNEDFFSITHKHNKILIVTKKHKKNATVQTINTTPETVKTDIQKLHADLFQS